MDIAGSFLFSQTILVWLLFCCTILLLAIHLREAKKRKKEEEKRKKEEDEARRETERINEARRITPLLFTGEEVDKVVVSHLFFEIMKPAERDKSLLWFENRKEIFGEINHEMIVSGQKRPLMTADEFFSWFMNVFNEGYFDIPDPTSFFGGQLSMVNNLRWAKARIKSTNEIDLQKLLQYIIEQTKQLDFTVKEHTQLRIAAAKELKDLQEKAKQLDAAILNEQKAEEARWRLFEDVANFLKEWPERKNKLIIAENELNAHLQELLGVKKLGISAIRKMLDDQAKDIIKIKKAILEMEKWRKDSEAALQIETDKKLDHFDRMLEQAVDDLNRQREQGMKEIAEFFRKELDEFMKKHAELQNKLDAALISQTQKQPNKLAIKWPSMVATAFYLFFIIGGLFWVCMFSSGSSLSVFQSVTEDSLLSDSDPVKNEKFFNKELSQNSNLSSPAKDSKIEKPKEVCDTTPAFTPVVKKQETVCTTEACCYLKISFDKNLTEEQRVQSRRDAYQCVQALKKKK